MQVPVRLTIVYHDGGVACLLECLLATVGLRLVVLLESRLLDGEDPGRRVGLGVRGGDHRLVNGRRRHGEGIDDSRRPGCLVGEMGARAKEKSN
jgi:hypothetical protein